MELISKITNLIRFHSNNTEEKEEKKEKKEGKKVAHTEKE